MAGARSMASLLKSFFREPRSVCSRLFTCGGLLLISAGTALAQGSEQAAWEVLRSAQKSHSTTKRVTSVRALGFLTDDRRAVMLAEEALSDKNPDVRAAAATAIGQIGSTASVPALKNALQDKVVAVVLAASSALLLLGDASGYDAYYEILIGERKTGASLIEEHKQLLKNSKKMAELAFESGIGFVPYGGVGWGIVKAVSKDYSSPVRAAAATKLSNGTDGRISEALVKAASDKRSTVRVAALNAIARRGDPRLMTAILGQMTDKNNAVRYSAAAAIIRLSTLGELSKLQPALLQGPSQGQ
jgi:HEAT repeat protein